MCTITFVILDIEAEEMIGKLWWSWRKPFDVYEHVCFDPSQCFHIKIKTIGKKSVEIWLSFSICTFWSSTKPCDEYVEENNCFQLWGINTKTFVKILLSWMKKTLWWKCWGELGRRLEGLCWRWWTATACRCSGTWKPIIRKWCTWWKLFAVICV